MRHTIKGAAAFAALCAGALALSPMAYAATPTVPDIISGVHTEFGGGADRTTTPEAAWIGRIAGKERIQTSLHSLSSTKEATNHLVKNVFIVEKNSTVDALTLAPLAKRLIDNKGQKLPAEGSSAVVYANKDGLTDGAITSLDTYADNAKPAYFIIGGTAKLETIIDEQVGSPIYKEVKTAGVVTYRLDGKDRYETAYLVSGLVIGGRSVWNAGGEYGKSVILKADYERALREWKEADAKGVKLQKDLEAAQDAINKAYDELHTLISANKPVPGSVIDAHLVKLNNLVTTEEAALKNINDCSVSPVPTTCIGNEGSVYAAAKAAREAAQNVWAADTAQDQKAKAATDKITALQANVEKLSEAAKDAKDADKKNLVENLNVATANLKNAVVNGFNNTANDCIPNVVPVVDTQGKPVMDPKTNKQKMDPACMGAGSTYVAKQRKAFVDTVDAAWAAYSGKVVFATGTDFADALAAGPAAATLPAPILLTNGDSYMPTVTALGKGDANKSLYAVGGPAAKAAKDLVATKKYHSTIADGGKALYVGKDRYETAAKLSKSFFLGQNKNHTDFNETVALTSGVVGADAVVAGVWCVNNTDAGILLTRPDSLPTATADYIAFGDNSSAKQVAVKDLVIFGGYAAVSHETASVAWAKMGQ